jgi:tetratricopeptide (TPR) repeat protein
MGAILDELTDLKSLTDPGKWREPRHRSLYASLASSLSALAIPDQTVFRSLSVFRGSFHAASGRAVAGAEPEDLARLVDHSLLVSATVKNELRFSMLDMVREYGWSQSSTAEQQEVQRRHASYFRHLVADAETLHVNSGTQQHQGLWREADNIRLAAEWTLAHNDAETNSQLALGLVWLWAYAGAQQEGRSFLRRVVDHFRPTGLPAARLRVAEGMLACYQDDPQTGRECILAALPELEAAGMRRHALVARGSLGFASYLIGDFGESMEYALQNQQEFRMEGMARWDAHACHLLGLNLCELGALDQASNWHRESERIWHDLGDSAFVGIACLGHARVAWKRGDFNEASRIYSIAAEFFDNWPDPRGLAYAVEGLGRVATSAEQFARAARLLGAAQRMRESIGLRRDFVDGRDFEAATVRLAAGLGANYELEWKAGYSVPPGHLGGWVLALA